MLNRRCGRSFYFAYLLLFSLVLAVTTAKPAYAYVDPGAGLFLFQVIGSAFAGLGLLLRKRVGRFFGAFGRSATKAGSGFDQR